MAEEFNLDAAMDATMSETAASIQSQDGGERVEAETRNDAGETSVQPAGKTESPATGQVTAAPETPADDFPKSWKQDFKETWKTLDPKVKAEVLRRETDMERGVVPLKETAAKWQRFEKTLEPYMNTIKNVAGGDQFAAVQALMQADHVLRYGTPEQKFQYFEQLRNQYGIGTQEQLQARDPAVSRLEQQVSQLQNTLTDSQRRAMEQVQKENTKAVEAFASDPKHVYFDEVSDDIVKLIQTGHNLNDAYERAVWMNPVTRQKELVRIQDESNKAVKEAAKKESEAARKARGTQVESKDTNGRTQEPLGSWDDTMRETLADLKTRTT